MAFHRRSGSLAPDSNFRKANRKNSHLDRRAAASCARLDSRPRVKRAKLARGGCWWGGPLLAALSQGAGDGIVHVTARLIRLFITSYHYQNSPHPIKHTRHTLHRGLTRYEKTQRSCQGTTLSNAISSLNSDAPSGAGHREPSFSSKLFGR